MMKGQVFMQPVPSDLRVELPCVGESYPRLVAELALKTPSAFLVVECRAKIVLETELTREKLELVCAPHRRNIAKGEGQLRLCVLLTPELIDRIERHRAGGNLGVYVDVDELYALGYEQGNWQNQEGQKSGVSIATGKALPESLVLIQNHQDGHLAQRLPFTREKWTEKFLQPLGMGKRIVIEIPVEIEPVTGTTPTDQDLKDLEERIMRAAREIAQAIPRYQSTRDVKAGLDDARRISDTLHNISNRAALMPKFGDHVFRASGTASPNISEDLVKQVFLTVDAVFNMASKSPHSTVNQKLMEYAPDVEDAEAALGVLAMVCKLLAAKLERTRRLKGS